MGGELTRVRAIHGGEILLIVYHNDCIDSRSWSSPLGDFLISVPNPKASSDLTVSADYTYSPLALVDGQTFGSIG